MRKEKINWEKRIEALLKRIKISEADFRRKRGTTSTVHN